MHRTIFVPSGRGRPGRPIPASTQLRLDTVAALCCQHGEIERVVFVGGAAPGPGPSMAAHMRAGFERDWAETAGRLELVVLAASNTTAGNVREMVAAAPQFGLRRSLPVVSRRAHFRRIVRHASRHGFTVDTLSIESVLGDHVMPTGVVELLWSVRRRAVWLWEYVDPDERVPRRAVMLARRFIWR